MVLEKAMGISNIKGALEDLRQGKMIILVDDEDRENEGDLTMALRRLPPRLLILWLNMQEA